MSVKSNLTVKQFDITQSNPQPLVQQQVKMHTKGRVKKLASKKETFVPFQLLLRFFDKQGNPIKDGAGDKFGLFINIGLKKELEIHFAKKEEKGKGVTQRKDDTATGTVGLADIDGKESLVFKVSKSSKMKPAGWKEAVKALKKYIPGYTIVIEQSGGESVVQEENTHEEGTPSTDPESSTSTEEQTSETTSPEDTTETDLESTDEESSTTEEQDSETTATEDEGSSSAPKGIRELVQGFQDLFKQTLPNTILPAIKERTLTPEHADTLKKAVEDAQTLLSQTGAGEKIQQFIDQFKKVQQPQLEKVTTQVEQQLEEYKAAEQELEALKKQMEEADTQFKTLIDNAPEPEETTSEEAPEPSEEQGN